MKQIIAVLCVYFLYRNLIQLCNFKSHYMKDIWSYIDLFLFSSLLGSVWIDEFTLEMQDTENIRKLLSFYSACALVGWLKLIYFARIYEETGAFVRMVIAIIKDLSVFLFFMLVTYTAFGMSDNLNFFLSNETAVINNSIPGAPINLDRWY